MRTMAATGANGLAIAGAQEAGTISARKSVLRRTVWLGISDSNRRIRPRAS
jgi:hypothetical protein